LKKGWGGGGGGGNLGKNSVKKLTHDSGGVVRRALEREEKSGIKEGYLLSYQSNAGGGGEVEWGWGDDATIWGKGDGEGKREVLFYLYFFGRRLQVTFWKKRGGGTTEKEAYFGGGGKGKG